jgi:hypothetical protein
MEDEWDPIEKKIGKPVEEMTPGELVSYVVSYFKARYDIELTPDWIIDRKILESFQKRYGKEKAGRIVQWVMIRKEGKKDGRYITFTIFSKGMKWWTDIQDLEVQDDRKNRETRKAAQKVADAGFFSLDDLVGDA